FDGGVIVRSHLRMRGRWSVVPAGSKRTGRPWLVLRGPEHEAVLWNGPVLELERGRTARLGPDILTERVRGARLRAADQRRQLGDVLLDQRVVAGIGNVWKAEALWQARVSPWRLMAECSDEELQRVLDEAKRLMQESLDGGRPRRFVYRKVGRPCP